MTHDPSAGPLSPDELLALGGLARLLVRSDGQPTHEEAAALERASEQLYRTTRLEGGAYRLTVTVREEGDQGAFLEMLRRAALDLRDEAAVRRAASAVTRQEARAVIFGLLWNLARSDTMAEPEREILGWLSDAWGIDTTQMKKRAAIEDARKKDQGEETARARAGPNGSAAGSWSSPFSRSWHWPWPP